MGQQQIFMIILVLIIVVLAVLLGMQLFKTENVAFTEDEYSQILMEQAEVFQTSYAKPELFGGGGKNWAHLSFSNVPCNFGTSTGSESASMVCNSNDRKFSVRIGYHNEYITMLGVAHIGQEDIHHVYTRELRVYPDSLSFTSDWVQH